MTNIVGTLLYKITGDSSTLERDLNNSRKEVVKTGESIEKMGTKIRKVSTSIITAVFVKSLIEATSRLQELNNKFDTVFSGMEIQAQEFIREYSKATSRGVIATKEFLSTQQDLRTGYGDSVQSAAKFSQAIVGITNDLASFSNVPVQDAMVAMQSGLTYQFEAMRRLGVSLSVAIIEQGNYAKSINKTWLEMNNLEKQEAVLSGIVSQSKNALHQNIQLWQDYNYKLGDAALTANSYANTSQGMNQSLEDTKAEIGENLLPLATLFSQTILTLSRGFNDLPNSVQLSVTSLGVFAASLLAISTGPVGITIGALGALTVALSNVKSNQERLNDSVYTLSVQSNNYLNIVNQLQDETKNLTDEEKALLEVKRELAKAQTEGALAELAYSYKEQEKKIENYTKKVDWAKGRYEAFKLAKTEGIESINNKISELLAKEDISNLEDSLLAQLQSISSDVSMALYEINDKSFNLFYSDLAESYEEKMDELSKLENPLNSAINEIANSVAKGIIDISSYEKSDKQLYDAIMKVVTSLELQDNSQENLNDSTKEAIALTSNYKNRIFENIAAKQEENNNFKNAAALRKVILENEKKEAIKKIASDYQLLAKDEDINKISISQLKDRISTNKNASEELNYLNIFYKQEKEKIDKEVLEKEKELIDEEKNNAQERLDIQVKNNQYYKNLVNQQKISLKESLAQEFENNGNYLEAYNIRKQLLNDEYDVEKKQLEEKIANNEATNEALLDLEKYYSDAQKILLDNTNSYIEKAEETKQEKLEKSREENSNKYLELLDNQAKLIKTNSANELEGLGKFEEAYQIRKQLLNQEYLKEKELLEDKKANNEATEEDLNNLAKYYAQEQLKLVEDKNKKIKESEKETAETIKKENEDTLKENLKNFNSFLNGFKSLSSEISSFLFAVTEKQIDELEQLKQKKLEDLGLAEESESEKLQREYNEAIKNGDLKLAGEKQQALEKLKIEEEFDEKKKKLQIESAKRSKEIKKFEASISTLQAVIGFLADPGDWAGVALSTMAAATGAAQIAAIEATPLPSYDVGTFNVTEDHIANIHQGEIIIPSSFSDSIRKGEAYLGKSKESESKVEITIINNTGADVSTESSENGNIKEYKIMIGKVVDNQIKDGRFDKSLSSRYGIRRSGYNA